MNLRASYFVAEDYSYVNSNETMDNVSSNVTIVSTELNVDTNSFADMISNFHRIENFTNNSIDETLRLEEFDKVLRNFEIQDNKNDCHSDDLNYNILDLDNLEYITNKKNIDSNSPSDKSCDNLYFLHEHYYRIRKEATPTCEEILNTSKLRDSDKTVENIFSGISDFNGIDYVGELNEVPQCYGTENNLQEDPVNFVTIPNNVSTDNISIYTISDDEQTNDDVIAISGTENNLQEDPVNFVTIPNNVSTDNISIYTISDDEQTNDDVISISSASSIEDIFDAINKSDSNSCGYNSSDFEFIDEHEAKKNGLIINYKPQINKEQKVKTIEIAKEYSSEQLILDYFNIPAVSSIEYKIPQDTNYISMFERNIPYPVHCMENKSIYTNNCSMNADYQDLGFNTSLYSREKVDKRVQDEANESEKKILFLYPLENRCMRKRRRT